MLKVYPSVCAVFLSVNVKKGEEGRNDPVPFCFMKVFFSPVKNCVANCILAADFKGETK